MLKYKAGLHKDVSAIFNGVSLPKNDGAQQPSAAPVPAHQNYDAPKPTAITSPASSPAVPKQPSTTSPASSPAVPKQPSTPLPASSPAVPKQPSTTLPASSPAAPKPAAPESPAQKPRAPSHMTPTKPKAGQAQWQRKLEQIKSKLFATEPGVNPIKQKAMVIVMPVLFIVLIFVFIRVFSTPSRKITGPAKAGPAKVAVASGGKVEWRVPDPYPATLRDPMQFGSARGGPDTGELAVKGIVYSEDNPTAVVGDQVVHQGDKILDVVITKINENSVEFEAKGKKWMQNVQR